MVTTGRDCCEYYSYRRRTSARAKPLAIHVSRQKMQGARPYGSARGGPCQVRIPTRAWCKARERMSGIRCAVRGDMSAIQACTEAQTTKKKAKPHPEICRILPAHEATKRGDPSTVQWRATRAVVQAAHRQGATARRSSCDRAAHRDRSSAFRERNPRPSSDGAS